MQYAAWRRPIRVAEGLVDADINRLAPRLRAVLSAWHRDACGRDGTLRGDDRFPPMCVAALCDSFCEAMESESNSDTATSNAMWECTARPASRFCITGGVLSRVRNTGIRMHRHCHQVID